MRVAHPYLAGPALVSSRRTPAFHPLHRPAKHVEHVRDNRLAEVALALESSQQVQRLIQVQASRQGTLFECFYRETHCGFTRHKHAATRLQE